MIHINSDVTTHHRHRRRRRRDVRAQGWWRDVATDGDAKRAREHLLQGARRLGVGSPVHTDDQRPYTYGYGRLAAAETAGRAALNVNRVGKAHAL